MSKENCVIAIAMVNLIINCIGYLCGEVSLLQLVIICIFCIGYYIANCMEEQREIGWLLMTPEIIHLLLDIF